MAYPLGVGWGSGVKKTPQTDFDSFRASFNLVMQDLREQREDDLRRQKVDLDKCKEGILREVFDQQYHREENDRYHLHKSMLTMQAEVEVHLGRFEGSLARCEGSLARITAYLEQQRWDIQALTQNLDGRLETLEEHAGIQYAPEVPSPRARLPT